MLFSLLNHVVRTYAVHRGNLRIGPCVRLTLRTRFQCFTPPPGRKKFLRANPTRCTPHAVSHLSVAAAIARTFGFLLDGRVSRCSNNGLCVHLPGRISFELPFTLSSKVPVLHLFRNSFIFHFHFSGARAVNVTNDNNGQPRPHSNTKIHNYFCFPAVLFSFFFSNTVLAESVLE